jgi:hypothetical protein
MGSGSDEINSKLQTPNFKLQTAEGVSLGDLKFEV